MALKLTVKQEKFSQGLFTGLSQREAYKQSYDCRNMTDKSIDEKACELANNVKIVSRLDELTSELKERNMVTVEKVLSELASIGFTNTTDFVAVEEKEYITGYEKDENGQDDKSKPIKQYGKGVFIQATDKVSKEKLKALAAIKQGANGIEVKMHDKVKALELMGKYLGMFTDNLAIANKDGKPFKIEEVSKLSDDELLEIINKK